LEGFSVRRHIERYRDVTDVVISLYHLSFVRAGQLEAILFKDRNVRGHFALDGNRIYRMWSEDAAAHRWSAIQINIGGS